MWIKAHIGLDGNELADRYAKQGAANTDIQIHSLVTRNEIKNKIEDACNNHWGAKWNLYKHCRQTKNFYPIPSPQLYRKTAQLSRSSLSTLIKIVTGQNNLNYLTNKIFPELTDQCRFCEEEEETFIHLLNECPVFNTFRNDLLKGSLVVGTVDWDPRVLVRFAQHPDIELALNARSNE